MRGYFILLAVVTLAYAKSIEQNKPFSAYGYIEEVAIPLGEEIRKQEEALLRDIKSGRIAGGSISNLGEFPYQAGLLTNFAGIRGTAVCGGCLVSADRVLTAAHCWFDGRNQGTTTEVVLGSVTLFFGGTRQSSRDVVLHPQWNPNLVRDDVAVVYLPVPVQFSSIISPIAFPFGDQLNEDFAGEVGIASGYGRTSDNPAGAISMQQTLRHASLNIITNAECENAYPGFVVDSNICTSGAGGISTCNGDSGGPLVVTREGEPILVGITSFGSNRGCTWGFPVAFARVSSFIDFFNEHL